MRREDQTMTTDQAMRALSEWGSLPEAPPGTYERPWLTTEVPPWVAPTQNKAPAWASLLVIIGLLLMTWSAVIGAIVYILR